MATTYFHHVHRNLDVPKECPNHGFLLYNSLEQAKEEAIKWAQDKDSKDIRFEDRDDSKYIYTPRVRYTSYYGSYDCIIELSPMQVFEP
jgi:hypothetical protein